MNKKSKRFITKLALYGTLLYTAASCVVGIGAFGVYLNSTAMKSLGLLRYAAAGLIGWLVYILARRKKQLYQWFYTFITGTFAGACLYTITPEMFGTVPGQLIMKMPGGPHVGVFLVWLITLALLIIPNTKDITLASIKGMILNAKPDTSNGFNFFVPAAAPAPAREQPSGGYKAIPFIRFGSLAGDKKFMSNPYTFPVGQKEDAKSLYAELGDDTPHFLLAGAPGSGKTVLLQTITAALAYKNTPQNLQLILIDGVRRGLLPLADLPHVIHAPGVLFEDNDVIEALEFVYNEVRARIQNDVCMPKVVTIIDEADGYFNDPKLKRRIEPLISYIVKKGRQFGIHLIIGSQRPSGDLISPHILSMLERICLKVKLPKYSENIIESPDGAALTGKGDLLYLQNGDLIHARAYYMDEKGKQEVSDFTRGVASMYEPAEKLFGSGLPGPDYPDPDDPDNENDVYTPPLQNYTPENVVAFTRSGSVPSYRNERNVVTPYETPISANGTAERSAERVPERSGTGENEPITGTPQATERGTLVVQMHDYEGLSFGQIATELNISKTSAKRIYDSMASQAASE